MLCLRSEDDAPKEASRPSRNVPHCLVTDTTLVSSKSRCKSVSWLRQVRCYQPLLGSSAPVLLAFCRTSTAQSTEPFRPQTAREHLPFKCLKRRWLRSRHNSLSPCWRFSFARSQRHGFPGDGKGLRPSQVAAPGRDQGQSKNGLPPVLAPACLPLPSARLTAPRGSRAMNIRQWLATRQEARKQAQS